VTRFVRGCRFSRLYRRILLMTAFQKVTPARELWRKLHSQLSPQICEPGLLATVLKFIGVAAVGAKNEALFPGRVPHVGKTRFCFLGEAAAAWSCRVLKILDGLLDIEYKPSIEGRHGCALQIPMLPRAPRA
jgi:hypothetical protein